MADRRIAEARATDVDTLRRALEVLADLELDTRGASELSDDTVGLRAIAAIAGADVRPATRELGAASRRGRGRRGTSCARRCCGAARRA